MVRTQIQITEGQSETLRRLASRDGKSVAGIIRDCLDKYLEDPRRNPDNLRERALKAAGRFSSGRSDVSAEHDRHLAEAFHA